MLNEILTHTPDDAEITAAMLLYGGSFVSHLGNLWRFADDDNRARLKAAFPEYWAEYIDLVHIKRGHSNDPRRV